MNYVLIQPRENDNLGYKDTGRLTFYRYEDLQCAAELFGQTYSSLACECSPGAVGGTNVAPAYSTWWGFFGNTLWSVPSMLHPDSQWLRMDRVQGLAHDYNSPIVVDSNKFQLPSYLYVQNGPFHNLQTGATTRDDSLSDMSMASAWVGAHFGRYDLDIRYAPFLSNEVKALGLSCPFHFKTWTDPRDISTLYHDVKTYCGWNINILTENDNLTYRTVNGQAFDQAWSPSFNVRYEDNFELNTPGLTSDEHNVTQLQTGWGNAVFESYQYWQKSEARWYKDGTRDPDDYAHYHWYWAQDTLVNTDGRTELERNVPVPTSAFGLSVLKERQAMFVWRADYTYHEWHSENPNINESWTRWYYYVADLSAGDVADFTDTNGEHRGLCRKYTMPFSAISSMHQAIVQDCGYALPQMSMARFRTDQGDYVDDELQELRITLEGAYSAQGSKLTEVVRYP